MLTDAGQMGVLLVVIFTGALTGCVTAPSDVSPPLSLFEDPSNNTFLPNAKRTISGVTKMNPYEGFIVAVKAANAAPTESDKQRVALNEGMAMIEYRCGEYFDFLGKALQNISYQRKETSLIGGLMQGSMGLANQSAKVIANTGAIFGFATSSMDAFQEAFMYTPDIGALRNLVFFGLQLHATNINTAIDGKALGYGQVVSYLKQYESDCQPGAIRDLVNQSVNKPVSTDSGQSEIATSALSSAVKAPLTTDQVFYLYWLQSDKHVSADDALLKTKLKDIGIVLDAAGDPDPDSAKKATSANFKFFSKSQIDKWNARIIIEHTPVAGVVAAPAEKPATAGSVAEPVMIK